MAKDSSKQLKELNNYPPEEALDPRQWKLQRERLQSDFTRALDNFQRAQRSAAQKEKDVIKKFKNHGGLSQPQGDDNLIDIEGGGQSKTQLMLEEEHNLEQLQERERAVRQLEADIGDVNQIFKDLAAMVHDQVNTYFLPCIFSFSHYDGTIVKIHFLYIDIYISMNEYIFQG